MARTVTQIQASMDDEQALHPTLVTNLNSPSQTSIYTLWKYITSLVIYFLETLWDIKKVELEEIVDGGAIHSDLWVQQRVFEFQYDAVTPQVVTLNTANMSVGYTAVDLTKRIITRCSVTTTGMRIVTVKVAKSDPPAALSLPEVTALQNYLTIGGDGTYAGRGVGIGAAGVKLVAISLNPDRLHLKATINYNGQYAPVISATVIAALENYFANIPFDGYVTVLGLTDAIQNVLGVSDIFIEDLAIREFYTPFASTTYLIQNFTELLTKLPLYAGYVIEEDTAGQDFATQLTFTGS